jgi:predicted neuraminidase
MRTRNGVVATTWSSDRGATWSELAPADLPNPNSGIDTVMLRNGRHLLVYNHPTSALAGSSPRHPLNVAVSSDGVEWKTVVTLEDQALTNGYAYPYPAVLQTSDGLAHTTYARNRQKIEHAVIDPMRLGG